MYLADQGSRATFMAASFPGAAIRRHTGTPFMGFGGATWLIQEVCNSLFDALFHILPLQSQMDAGATTTLSKQAPAIAWENDARVALDEIVSREPVLVRISAAKILRDRAEQAARESGEETVTAARVAASNNQQSRQVA